MYVFFLFECTLARVRVPLVVHVANGSEVKKRPGAVAQVVFDPWLLQSARIISLDTNPELLSKDRSHV